MNRRDFLASAVAAACAPNALSAAPLPYYLVDSHVHVWETNPRFPFSPGANVPPNVDASPSSLLAKMRSNNISRTVLIQVIHYKWDNRFLVATLRAHPEKFAAVCRVDPQDPAAPDHLSYWTDQGCRGVRLSPAANATGDWIRDPLMPPLWKRCEDLKVPMTLLLPVGRLPDIVPLLDKFPALTTVIDHMADCPVDDAQGFELLRSLARYPNLYLKVSHPWSLSKLPYPYPDVLAMIARLRDSFGTNRLMWGTDWPIKPELLSYDRRVALYRDHLPFLSKAEHRQLLAGTATRVWPS
ncbi:MAG TPA: amidohydrolase family protein [Acidobacteriaceae bacterium]|nr:amidohydrolase family protein [Acidobacteriaceae bacterium]